MKQVSIAATAVLMMAVVVGGCGTMAGGSAEAPPSLDGTGWVLSSLPGRTLLPGSAGTARFEGGRVSGSDGCNRYNSACTAQGSALQVDQRGASTMMACPPEVVQQAAAFRSALAGVRSYRVSGGELQLLGAGGAAVMSFAPQPTTLAGTSWRVTRINNGRGGVASLVADTQVTMNFAADGRVAGSAGCNNYSAGYQAEGTKLRLTPAAATRRMCSNPAAMQQEQAFLKALESVSMMNFEGDRLDLRTADDALAVGLTRAAP